MADFNRIGNTHQCTQFANDAAILLGECILIDCDCFSVAMTAYDPGDHLVLALVETDAVEVSHTNRIHDVKLQKAKRGWQLRMYGEGNLLLERWALDKHKSLFEEVFDTTLEIIE